EWTKSEVKKIILLLRRSGYHQAGNFLDRHIDHLTTAAELAISKGIHVPWTTNKIERMMKEIGKRTKKKGMCWSESGLMRITSLNIKRYMVPFKQRKYLMLFGDSIVDVVTKWTNSTQNQETSIYMVKTFVQIVMSSTINVRGWKFNQLLNATNFIGVVKNQPLCFMSYNLYVYFL
ncbi:MAG: hypothetical protein DRN71_05420, partial [Candidatus Nanohalarchaeota archaeon]